MGVVLFRDRSSGLVRPRRLHDTVNYYNIDYRVPEDYDRYECGTCGLEWNVSRGQEPVLLAILTRCPCGGYGYDMRNKRTAGGDECQNLEKPNTCSAVP